MMTSQQTLVRSAGTPRRNYELQAEIQLILDLYAIELVELLTLSFQKLDIGFDSHKYAALIEQLKPHLHDEMFSVGNSVNYLDNDTAGLIVNPVLRLLDGGGTDLDLARTEAASIAFVQYAALRLSSRHTQEESMKQQVARIGEIAVNRGVFPSEVLLEWKDASLHTFGPSVKPDVAPLLKSILTLMYGLKGVYMVFETPTKGFTEASKLAADEFFAGLKH